MKVNGPKQLLHVMPRTDFETIHKLVLKDKLENGRSRRKKTKEEVNIFTISRDLAKKDGFEGDMDTLEFMWEVSSTTRVSTPEPDESTNGEGASCPIPQ
jgi:hypothetical protein